MELLRVVGNVLIGLAVTVIAFSSKTPSEALRFLRGCMFDSSNTNKHVRRNND